MSIHTAKWYHINVASLHGRTAQVFKKACAVSTKRNEVDALIGIVKNIYNIAYMEDAKLFKSDRMEVLAR